MLYMLEGVGKTANTTLSFVEGIRSQMAGVKQRMRAELPKLYSQDLLNNLFRHPYTRIDYVVQDLEVTRQTAAKYLDTLAEHGLSKSIRPDGTIITSIGRWFACSSMRPGGSDGRMSLPSITRQAALRPSE